MHKLTIASAASLFAGSVGAHEGLHAEGLGHQLLHAVSDHLVLLCVVVGAALTCLYLARRKAAARAD